MAKKPFDPFDERHRDKVKRRKPHEVAADRKAWNDRIDNHIRRELDVWGWPDYVDSEAVIGLIPYNPETNVGIEVIKRNFRVAMERLGYEKFTSESNKGGRWKVAGVWTVVYVKRGAARIGRSELKQALGR